MEKCWIESRRFWWASECLFLNRNEEKTTLHMSSMWREKHSCSFVVDAFIWLIGSSGPTFNHEMHIETNLGGERVMWHPGAFHMAFSSAWGWYDNGTCVRDRLIMVRGQMSAVDASNQSSFWRACPLRCGSWSPERDCHFYFYTRRSTTNLSIVHLAIKNNRSCSKSFLCGFPHIDHESAATQVMIDQHIRRGFSIYLSDV